MGVSSQHLSSGGAFDCPIISARFSPPIPLETMLKSHFVFLIFIFPLALFIPPAIGLLSVSGFDDSLPYLWPLPADFTFGDQTLSVDPQLSLAVAGNGGSSEIVKAAFDRYRGIIFKHTSGVSVFDKLWGRRRRFVYDISELKIVVHSDSEEVSWSGELLLN